MPCVGFEPIIPASERAKTVHALDRSAAVTGHLPLVLTNCLSALRFPTKILYALHVPSVHAAFAAHLIMLLG
jgi:hypothetical protein